MRPALDPNGRPPALLFALLLLVAMLAAGACAHGGSDPSMEPGPTPPASDLPSCTSDADCPGGTWCRAREGGGSECVPFAQEGDRCGGFTMPSHQERCAPDLECTDFPEPTRDVPGYCRPVEG